MNTKVQVKNKPQVEVTGKEVEALIFEAIQIAQGALAADG